MEQKQVGDWAKKSGAQIGTHLLGGPDRAVIWTGEVLSGAEEKPFQTYGEMCFWRGQSATRSSGNFFLQVAHYSLLGGMQDSSLLFICSGETFRRVVVRSDGKHGLPPTGKVWFSAHRPC